MIILKNNIKLVNSYYNFDGKDSFTGIVKDNQDNVAYYLNGKLHREDGPAIKFYNDSKEWYLNGKRHREDGPAIEWVIGHKEWHLNGKRHREDGPAVEESNGYKEWHLNGKHYGYNDDFTNKSWIRFIELEFLK